MNRRIRIATRCGAPAWEAAPERKRQSDYSNPTVLIGYDDNPSSIRLRVATWCVVLILVAIIIWSVKP